MCGYPQFSFWISITLVKIYISCKIVNRGKNIFELVGTVLKQVREEVWSSGCPGFKSRSGLWFGFVSGCPGFNSATLCK